MHSFEIRLGELIDTHFAGNPGKVSLKQVLAMFRVRYGFQGERQALAEHIQRSQRFELISKKDSEPGHECEYVLDKRTKNPESLVQRVNQED